MKHQITSKEHVSALKCLEILLNRDPKNKSEDGRILHIVARFIEAYEEQQGW